MWKGIIATFCLLTSLTGCITSVTVNMENQIESDGKVFRYVQVIVETDGEEPDEGEQLLEDSADKAQDAADATRILSFLI